MGGELQPWKKKPDAVNEGNDAATNKPAAGVDAARPTAGEALPKVAGARTAAEVANFKAQEGLPDKAPNTPGAPEKPEAPKAPEVAAKPAENPDAKKEDPKAKAEKPKEEKPKKDPRGVLEQLMDDPAKFFKNSLIVKWLMKFSVTRDLIVKYLGDSLDKDIVLEAQANKQGLNKMQVRAFSAMLKTGKLKELERREIESFKHVSARTGLAMSGLDDLVSIGRKSIDTVKVNGVDKKVKAFREFKELAPDPTTMRFGDVLCYKLKETKEYLAVVIKSANPAVGECVYRGKKYDIPFGGSLSSASPFPAAIQEAGVDFYVAYQRMNEEEKAEAYVAEAKRKQEEKAKKEPETKNT